MSRSVGGKPPWQTPQKRIEIQTFRDFQGYTAYRVFTTTGSSLLPPFAWQVYVTFPVPDSFREQDLTALWDSLCTRTYAEIPENWRLEIYLAPNAVVDDCKRHFQAERLSRSIQPAELQVPNYAIGARPYAGFFILISKPDWQEDLTLVLFDLVPDHEGADEDTPEQFVFEHAPVALKPATMDGAPPPRPRTTAQEQMDNIWSAYRPRHELMEAFEQAVEKGNTSW